MSLLLLLLVLLLLGVRESVEMPEDRHGPSCGPKKVDDPPRFLLLLLLGVWESVEMPGARGSSWPKLWPEGSCGGEEVE
eukprot:6926985-Pyramimonas_sp.AAC.1